MASYNQGLTSTSSRCVLEGLSDASTRSVHFPNEEAYLWMISQNQLEHFGYLAPVIRKSHFPVDPVHNAKHPDINESKVTSTKIDLISICMALQDRNVEQSGGEMVQIIMTARTSPGCSDPQPKPFMHH